LKTMSEVLGEGSGGTSLDDNFKHLVSQRTYSHN
jgi:hypothetical protein